MKRPAELKEVEVLIEELNEVYTRYKVAFRKSEKTPHLQGPDHWLAFARIKQLAATYHALKEWLKEVPLADEKRTEISIYLQLHYPTIHNLWHHEYVQK